MQRPAAAGPAEQGSVPRFPRRSRPQPGRRAGLCSVFPAQESAAAGTPGKALFCVFRAAVGRSRAVGRALFCVFHVTVGRSRAARLGSVPRRSRPEPGRRAAGQGSVLCLPCSGLRSAYPLKTCPGP